MKKFLLTLLPLLCVPVLSAQDIPDGPGKDTTIKICTACHDLGVLTNMNGGADIWQSVIDDMKSRGADGSDEEFKSIVAYLTKYYGPVVKINTDSAADIKTNLALTDAEAAAIVKYRTDNGGIKSWDDLMKVPGLDTSKLKGLQSRVKYQ